MRRMFSSLVLAGALALLFFLPAAGQEGSTRFYEVERINEGLGARPEWLNLETPQALMETFLAATRAHEWEAAAHTLDLDHVDPGEQAQIGPELARMLSVVVERGMWLDWADLSDRPDAIEENASSKRPLAGEPRRNIRLALLELPDRPVAIRIARLKAAGGDPVWMFSRQTVDNIPALHAVYGPTEFELALPDALQGRAFWTLTWWEVVALPVVLAAALVAALLTYRLLGTLDGRQRFTVVSRIIAATRTPLALLVFASAFWLVRKMVFTFSGAVNAFVVPVTTILFVVAFAMLAVRIVDAILERLVVPNLRELGTSDSADERDLYTNLSAIRRITIFVAFLIGAALVLVQVHAFESLGFSLLASAGVIGLVLAFAARSMLADVMASIQIALAKTARIGDAVLFDGQWCYVEKINFTYIQLQSWDNRRLMVPVNTFLSQTFENWSKQDASIIETVELCLDPTADVERLREPFRRFVEEAEDVIEKDEAKVQVIDQSAAGMIVRFTARACDPSAGWHMHCRLREAMLRAAVEFEAETSPERVSSPVYLPRAREVEFDHRGRGAQKED